MTDEAPTTIALRDARLDDSEALRAIYNHEVEHGTGVFDLVPRTAEAQRAWLTQRQGVHRVLVAVDTTADRVVGFASLSPYKDRPAYNPTVENSVYVAPSHQGQGVGLLLLRAICDAAREHGFHSVIARIAGENTASIRVHERAGFGKVGHEREVGRKFGRWLDVVIMQRML